MQRYSHPEVFLCPYYNVPGISNPKMDISKDGFDQPPRFSPALGTSQGLTTPTLVQPSDPAQSSDSQVPSRDTSLSPEPVSSSNSECNRKVDDYDRIFEELIDAE